MTQVEKDRIQDGIDTIREELKKLVSKTEVLRALIEANEIMNQDVSEQTAEVLDQFSALIEKKLNLN